MMTNIWTPAEKQRLRDLSEQGMTLANISTAMGRSEKAIQAMRSKLGLGEPRSPITMPDEFRANGCGMTIRQIMERYRICYNKASAWRDACGFPRIQPKKSPTRMPDDFREVGPTMSMNEAARYYRAHNRAVRRWHAEAGTTSRAPVATPKKRLGTPSTYNIRQPIQFGAPGDGSIAGAAANHLRRIGYTNVYKATVLDIAARKHLPDDGRQYYCVSGKGLIHQDEMIRLAAHHGFRQAA
ncbi:hypothetical protein [Sphingomonas sp. SRS2]|uniref:hypothetical protein n=1 Tax=Sphingomonas sp. SRS2 TaxID=133190 RepID=UPI0006184ED8|nr:hypothetical protein [Sphingomonas sp. SRS2]KKC25813.1 hypothetical protein WP12_12220 [Sphingomonas sp. SRS2]